jgi:hypothetical protein
MEIHLLDAPFPHVIVKDFFTEEELALVYQELDFLTLPGKLLAPGQHHSSIKLTSSKALHLEKVYNIPEISNILQLTKKALDAPFINVVATKWPHFKALTAINNIITKVRYYHNGEGYEPHTDIRHSFLSFMYFHTQPKKFEGGEIYFPEYNYEISCDHNTLVLLGGYVQHGVKTVIIEDDEYWNKNGRYCISQFMDALFQ